MKEERRDAEIEDPQSYSQAVQDHREWQGTPSQANEEPPATQEEQARQAPVHQRPGSASIRRQAGRAFVRQATSEVMIAEQIRRRIERELQATRTEAQRPDELLKLKGEYGLEGGDPTLTVP